MTTMKRAMMAAWLSLLLSAWGGAALQQTLHYSGDSTLIAPFDAFGFSTATGDGHGRASVTVELEVRPDTVPMYLLLLRVRDVATLSRQATCALPSPLRHEFFGQLSAIYQLQPNSAADNASRPVTAPSHSEQLLQLVLLNCEQATVHVRGQVTFLNADGDQVSLPEQGFLSVYCVGSLLAALLLAAYAYYYRHAVATVWQSPQQRSANTAALPLLDSDTDAEQHSDGAEVGDEDEQSGEEDETAADSKQRRLRGVEVAVGVIVAGKLVTAVVGSGAYAIYQLAGQRLGWLFWLLTLLHSVDRALCAGLALLTASGWSVSKPALSAGERQALLAVVLAVCLLSVSGEQCSIPSQCLFSLSAANVLQFVLLLAVLTEMSGQTNSLHAKVLDLSYQHIARYVLPKLCYYDRLLLAAPLLLLAPLVASLLSLLAFTWQGRLLLAFVTEQLLSYLALALLYRAIHLKAPRHLSLSLHGLRATVVDNSTASFAHIFYSPNTSSSSSPTATNPAQSPHHLRLLARQQQQQSSSSDESNDESSSRSDITRRRHRPATSSLDDSERSDDDNHPIEQSVDLFTT